MTFMANYMFGRSMDTGLLRQAPVCAITVRAITTTGRSIFDVRQRFVASINYELPFGKNSTGLMKQVIGGWELNSITTLQTGLPFYVTSTDFSNTATTSGAAPIGFGNRHLPPVPANRPYTVGSTRAALCKRR